MSNQQKPKEELHSIMVEMFGMIEELNIQEGHYLQFAEMFKTMNININRLAEMKEIIYKNVYYQRYVKNRTTIKRKRLTEAEKACHHDYILCNCGCLIHKDEQLSHINTTLKHRQGLRNKKFASKHAKADDPIIDFEINRDIVLQGFCIIHYSRINNIKVDDDETCV